MIDKLTSINNCGLFRILINTIILVFIQCLMLIEQCLHCPYFSIVPCALKVRAPRRIMSLPLTRALVALAAAFSSSTQLTLLYTKIVSYLIVSGKMYRRQILSYFTVSVLTIISIVAQPCEPSGTVFEVLKQIIANKT